METNQPWNWGLIVLKTVKMVLVRSPHDQFRMTVRADCSIFAGNPLPLSIKALVHGLSRGRRSQPLFRSSPSSSVASIQNRANFPFHQSGPFIGFWAVSNQPPLSVTIWFQFYNMQNMFISVYIYFKCKYAHTHTQTQKAIYLHCNKVSQ